MVLESPGHRPHSWKGRVVSVSEAPRGRAPWMGCWEGGGGLRPASAASTAPLPAPGPPEPTHESVHKVTYMPDNDPVHQDGGLSNRGLMGDVMKTLNSVYTFN